jgi:hypothetical protein
MCWFDRQSRFLVDRFAGLIDKVVSCRPMCWFDRQSGFLVDRLAGSIGKIGFSSID